MKASTNCYALIKHYEGFQPKPYPCPAGVTTIGIGTTIYPDGKKVRLNDPAITEAEATDFLIHDLTFFELAVNRLLKVPVQQYQFDALISFAYNLGDAALAYSTLLELINHGVFNDPNWKKRISAEFLKWCKATVAGKKVALGGLLARRTSEAFLFCDNTLKFFN